NEILDNFQDRHRNLLASVDIRTRDMDEIFSAHAPFSQTQRHLLGTYFLQEYSFEAAALFNPSIVMAPDQSHVPPGALRFILSLRAVGEGHVSSLTFRTGLIASDGTISLEPAARLASLPQVQPHEPGAPADSIDVAFNC